ncbi:unnamed protein product [Spirodela intermedia]|uniref:Uncharacterized protein n=1 Tax=Spirodela intermedia TaxID=51605 RepID=A0A7I8ILS3_SPIIN|nr:unnamed protein product [Spirodela intermedia]CAA6658696.1 unnamed protein product [Spirodela intermedia]
MRNRSTSSKGKRGKEAGITELKEDPHLSGAYLRRLVKQLGSSLPRATTDPKASQGFGETHPQGAATQHRKQARRRVHTSKPYQERVINMAEARREIVTALRVHRAAMKRASEQQQLHQENHNRGEPLNFNSPILPSTLCPPFSWPYSNVAPIIPCRPLGLNLNLEGFADRGTSISGIRTSLSDYSSSSSSTAFRCPSASPETKSASEAIAKSAATRELHLSVDEEEMARIISIGEQHDLEWNDKLNSVTSAWWSELLQAAEASAGGEGKAASSLAVPALLSDRQEHMDDRCCLSKEHMQDNLLSRLENGEFAGVDSEWLT